MIDNNNEAVVWLDGVFKQVEEANVNIRTHALHYGSSVFEGIRSYDGVVFKLEEHLERLFRSAELLGFKIPFEKAVMTGAVHELIKLNQLDKKQVYIRPIVWCGTKKLTIGNRDIDIHAAILAWERDIGRGSERYEQGIRLTLSRWCRPPQRCFPIQSKAGGNYVISSMSRVEAERNGFDDAILLDDRGYVSEASSSNLFIVKEGKLIMPRTVSCLNGITRQITLKIAKKLGIESEERDFLLDEIFEADEMFLTGTAIELLPVKEFFSETRSKVFDKNPITRTLMGEYQKETTLIGF